jgi:hypothetical protein
MKVAWSTRFNLSRWPQSAQVWLVYAESTYTSGTPARRALYSRKSPS